MIDYGTCLLIKYYISHVTKRLVWEILKVQVLSYSVRAFWIHDITKMIE